jgi:ferredoxin-NADP reductase
VARAALPRRLSWQLGRVVELTDTTPRAKNIVLELPKWTGHRAGQHVDVRLTAADGYQAQRSYSIASGPEDAQLMLTVERLDDGEVSPYLHDELLLGDELELRGPIGGYFVWEESLGGPLLMIAGGSGVAPFRAMARHWATGARQLPARLVYSARTITEVVYLNELNALAEDDGLDLTVALTRGWPEDWRGHKGRVDRALLAELAPAGDRPLVYVCGPTGFVEAVAQALVGAGHDPGRIRTERFGPTGS